MSNPVSINNSNGINGNNEPYVSPSSKVGTSPSSSPVSSKSSFDVNRKNKTIIVKNLLNRSNSGTSFTLGSRRTYPSSPIPSFASPLHNGDLDNDLSDHEKIPDSPKANHLSNSSIINKEHSNSTSSNSSQSEGFSSSLGGNGLINNSNSSNQHVNGDSAYIDRTLWTVRSLKEHPEIQDIMERVKPISRSIALSQTYASEETLLKHDPLIGHDTMLLLILQHLQYEGLSSSKKILEEEANVKYPDYAINESRLVSILRAAIKDSDKIYSLTLDEKKDSLLQLEEHLAFLGLLKEEQIEVGEDVNIYDEPENSNIIYSEEKEDKNKNNDKDTTTAATGATGGNTSSPQLTMSPSNSASSMGSNANLLSSSSGMSKDSSLSLSSLSLSGKSGTPIEPIKSIKAASLNKLVILLTPEKNHDLEYAKTFLLTYQSFTTPEKLLQKLIQRYHVPQKQGQTEFEWRKIAVPIQLRVVNILKTWIKDYFSDFNDKLIQTVKSFCESLRHDGNNALSNRISDTLNRKIKGLADDDEHGGSEKSKSIFTTPAPEPKVPKNIWSQTLNIFDIDDEEIARQLTLMDFEIFYNIKATELLNQSWNKPKLRSRSPNVLILINRFNEISQWTASRILDFPRIKDRSRIMARFIKIAEYCMRSLNNFNTSMAILSGLNAASVHRLKFTKEEMPKHTQQVYTELQAQLSSNSAYKEYRAILSKSNPPCLPYLGVYLTDLTFFEEGNPDYIQGFINFSKRKLIYNSISNVQSFQNTKYNLQPVYQIATLLKNLPRSDEDKLYHKSMAYEPRNKERSEIL
ncbi:hypothetical protein CYY_007175 [Polysphondylium violaceum]|uniref:Ras guanine nucleotide exchange factor n=1 Tax=Polysphondylium violaceum TaxID=133409 RepID=A0A8J4PPZ1_9MYCE|nr:hypothetical protein CYY_007175 [Polysphondylium violaceum]